MKSIARKQPMALIEGLPGKLSLTGLHLNEGLTYETWEAIVQQFIVMEKGIMCWIGDALCYGEKNYGEKYTQALDATRYSYGTLRNAHWVMSRVEVSRRRDSLDFGHFQNVAHLSADQQGMWLEQAELNGWSVMRLREEIAAAKEPQQPQEPYDVLFDQPTTPEAQLQSALEVIGALPEEQRQEVIAQIVESADGDSVRNQRVQQALSDIQETVSEKPTETYEWYTPSVYIEAARSVMGSIDLDPASCEAANSLVKAEVFYSREQDGLSQPWQGKVWLNPPYCMPQVQQFVERCLAAYQSGAIAEAVILINNTTDAAYTQTLMAQADAVCFTRGRIHFFNGHKDGPLEQEVQTRQGQIFFYLGPNRACFAQVFARFGTVMEVLQ